MKQTFFNAYLSLKGIGEEYETCIIYVIWYESLNTNILNPIWLPLLYIIQNVDAWCLRCMKIFQNEITATVRPLFHTNTCAYTFMLSQGKLLMTCISKTSIDTPYFYYLFLMIR